MQIDEKLLNEYLRYLCMKYNRRFGYGIRNLNQFEFTTLDDSSDLPEGIFDYKNNLRTSKIHEITKELESEGFIVRDGCKFFLTERGYKHATRNFWEKILENLNRNPGLLAMIAILISTIALFKS